MPNILDITPDEYFERPEISNSCLRCYLTDGPLVCYHRYIARDMPAQDSEAFRFGAAFHVAAADPNEFDSLYHSLPSRIEDDEWAGRVRVELERRKSKADFHVGDEINRKKSAHRMYLEMVEESVTAQGGKCVSQDDRDRVWRMIDAIHSHAQASEYAALAGPQNTEVSYVSTDEATGLGIKAMVDLDLGPIIVDYKTTRHTRPSEFLRDIRKQYKYQAEWYLRVTGAQKFVFIGITKDWPHECFVFAIERATLHSTNNILASDVGGVSRSVSQANDAGLLSLKSSMDWDQWHNNLHGAEVVIDDSTYERLAI